MYRIVVATVFLHVLPAQVVSIAERLKDISKIEDPTERLKAYDALASSLDTAKEPLTDVRAKVEELLAHAAKARAESLLTRSRTATGKALRKTLANAWSLTASLKTSGNSLRMLIENSRGACQETLGHIAKHRREQEVAKIKALQQKRAVLAYERTLELKDESPEATAAQAWALYRIAVLSEAIADFHQGIKESYTKFRKSYPMAYLVDRFRLKSHRARERLAASIEADKEKYSEKLTSEGEVQLVEQLARAHEWATQEAKVLDALDINEAMRQARGAIKVWNAFRKAAGLPEVHR